MDACVSVANPTVLPCGNLAKIVSITMFVMPTMPSKNSMNKLKKTSSVSTTRISNKTTDIKEAKNNFRTIFGFLFEINFMEKKFFHSIDNVCTF